MADELNEALDRSKGTDPILMDHNTVNTLVSYLEHLDYLHKKETHQETGKPPKVPCYLREGACGKDSVDTDDNIEEIIDNLDVNSENED